MPIVLVPTPLGNLGDITLRAKQALGECALLVAEDSRVARKLLTALDLPGKEIWTYHDHNARSATPAILERAKDALVCVVTDAGTPGISDPGTELVAAARDAQIPVEVLPGPSALVGAAVLSGFPLRRFIFEGFAPRTSAQRKKAFAASLALGIPSVWYESPQRIRATLADLEAVDQAARVFLVREYTKRFEQQVAGSAGAVAAQLEEPVRGEIAFVVMPSKKAAQNESLDLDQAIKKLLEEGESVSAIAKKLSERGLGERNRIYETAARFRQATKESSRTGG